MKKGQSKTRYFRKDYAPARALAQRKKSQRKSTAVTKNLKKLAQTTSKSAKKVLNTSKNIAKNLSTRLSDTGKKPTLRSHRSARGRKPKHPPMTWRESTLLGMVGASTVAIIAALISSVVFDPVRRSERELDKLADAYYVEYLYPRAVGGNFDEAENILKDFTIQGLPNVRLRQLLLFDNAKFADSTEVFSNAHYECDTNKSYIRYYPVEPYGPRDYTVYYGTACEKLDSLD